MSRRRGVPIWALRGRGGTVVAPCGPASRQEQESRRRAETAAAVGLAVGFTSSGRWPRGPAGPESIINSGGALPVAVAIRRRVVDDGGAGTPSKTETDTVQPVVAAGAVSCVELWDRYVGCALGVAVAKSSAEPVPPSMEMAKTGAKTVSAEGEIESRPVQPSAVATEVETQATNLPGEAQRPSLLIRD